MNINDENVSREQLFATLQEIEGVLTGIHEERAALQRRETAAQLARDDVVRQLGAVVLKDHRK